MSLPPVRAPSPRERITHGLEEAAEKRVGAGTDQREVTCRSATERRAPSRTQSAYHARRGSRRNPRRYSPLGRRAKLALSTRDRFGLEAQFRELRRIETSIHGAS